MSDLRAVIDLGTNTARLLIGKVDAAGIIEHLHVDRRITRLGGGFTATHGISVEAMTRNEAALSAFAATIHHYGVASVWAVATSAVRDAVNGAFFCQMMAERSGIRLEVIDGTTEGILTLKGVLAGIAEQERPLLVFDIGGGSTEYTLCRERQPVFTRSLPLGVVRLTEGKASVAAMTEKIERELDGLHRELAAQGIMNGLSGYTLVGTAGTATTLAAISLGMTEYDYRRVNGYTMSADEVRRIYELLLPLSPAERLEVPGLERGREDLIIAGTLVVITTMVQFGFPSLEVSDFGLLEGLLLECFGR